MPTASGEPRVASESDTSTAGTQAAVRSRPNPLKWRLPRARWALWDIVTWIAAYYIALVAYWDSQFPSGLDWRYVGLNALLMGLLQVVVGSSLRLYQGRFRYGTFDEGRLIAVVAVCVFVLSSIADMIITPPDTSVGLDVIATALAISGMLGRRALWRGIVLKRGQRRGKRTVILGAGPRGCDLASEMLTDPKSDYVPIGFLDDNPARKRLTASGVRVHGGSDELETVAVKTQADVLVVTLDGLGAQELGDLDSRCRAIGMQLRVLPSITEVMGGAVKIGDISDVAEEDLLGRRPIHTDESEIHSMLHGRRVLITGAGGSIGSEIARQVHLYGPEFLGMLDRDESALADVQLSIEGRSLLDSDELILCDIRDQERVNEVLRRVRPDIVLHAAALKHVTFLQRTPAEAFKTNVVGTLNVLRAAQAVGVPVIVNVSTDKAADPQNALGFSKRAAERLTAGLTPPQGGRYLSVRFGNVLGSRGSVLPIFRRQIAEGGPVTVTDPEVTRYFMTISEAVHLVLEAATFGGEGETLILDMGTPVKIATVAELMIEKSRRDIRIEYTGLRPGEKMHEVLEGENERGIPSPHALITCVKVPPLAGDLVPGHVGPADAMSELKSLALE